tara:strand:+ start:1087 stop:1311 length:225 start_codon:yes stop_codon:yes gene_type:complete
METNHQILFLFLSTIAGFIAGIKKAKSNCCGCSFSIDRNQENNRMESIRINRPNRNIRRSSIDIPQDNRDIGRL